MRRDNKNDANPRVDISEKLKEAYKDVFSSPQGILVLSHILALSGWNKVSVSTSPISEVNIHSTVYNEGRRSVMFDLRNWVPIDLLHKAEKLTPDDV